MFFLFSNFKISNFQRLKTPSFQPLGVLLVNQRRHNKETSQRRQDSKIRIEKHWSANIGPARKNAQSRRRASGAVAAFWFG